MQCRVPYGYQIVSGQIMIFDEQADIVREIFRRYSKGDAMGAIAKNLNARQITYTGGKTSWTHVIIGKILENKIYLGNQYYQMIIDEKQYKQVQEIRKQYCKNRGKGVYRPDKEERELFDEMIICDECGMKYRRLRPTGSGKKIPKWKCQNKSEQCAKTGFSDEQIKKICVMAINRVIDDNDLVREAKEPEASFSKAFLDLEHQISMDNKENADELFDLIIRRAEERYRTLSVRDVRCRTEAILRLIEGREKLEYFDEELYRRIIREIRISPNNARVIFINGSGIYIRI